MAIQATPRPDFGQIKCPDCDALMKPVSLPKSDSDGTPLALECPKCGRRVEKSTR
jgi:ribosomal protein S27E